MILRHPALGQYIDLEFHEIGHCRQSGYWRAKGPKKMKQVSTCSCSAANGESELMIPHPSLGWINLADWNSETSNMRRNDSNRRDGTYMGNEDMNLHHIQARNSTQETPRKRRGHEWRLKNSYKVRQNLPVQNKRVQWSSPMLKLAGLGMPRGLPYNQHRSLPSANTKIGPLEFMAWNSVDALEWCKLVKQLMVCPLKVD